MEKPVQVAHLTTVHSRYDTRIFLKECRTLAKEGYAVSLVVADGRGDEIRDGVTILDVGAPNGRIDRMLSVTRRVFNRGKALEADVYHAHDPELIPICLKLKRGGKRIVFDAHEDIPKQLMGKPYLNRPAKWMLSRAFGLYEALACKGFDAVLTATPTIRDKFLAINPTSVDINNFPLLGELASVTLDWRKKQRHVCYIGGIGTIRGIKEVVQAMAIVSSGARLQLGGQFSEKNTETEVKACDGWRGVDELGFVSREGVREVLGRSVAGLVTFHALPNHVDAQPNKMFEYMSAGVPVIASHFPLWREIVEGNDCGLCVDPMSPEAIAAAIDFLVTNPRRAQQMGENGQRAVRERYNWSIEEKKLIELYAGMTR